MPEVRVVRSARRRRTASAREVGGVIEVRVPAGMAPGEEALVIERLVRRAVRRGRGERIDLAQRAEVLARRYDLPLPREIRWSENQASRWGSCTPATEVIRLSNRLASYPGWVLDYVIVHELAHLLVPGHGPAFWEIVGRYPLTERARGFLIAMGRDDSPDAQDRD